MQKRREAEKKKKKKRSEKDTVELEENPFGASHDPFASGRGITPAPATTKSSSSKANLATASAPAPVDPYVSSAAGRAPGYGGSPG